MMVKIMNLNLESTVQKNKIQPNEWLFNRNSRKTIADIGKDISILGIQSFNVSLLLENPWLEKYIYFKTLSSLDYKRELTNLLNIDQGGFEHGDLSGLYVTFQNSPRYSSTRLCGWNNLLQIAFSSIGKKSELEDGLILDFLAGSGTLSKKVKQLTLDKTPTVIGIDVSKRMVDQAQKYKETVFWASCATHPFKRDIADVTVAAYGFHHVPLNQRDEFVSNMQKPLKKDGICIVHDFEEGSATARWYSEVIHSYRTVGHPYSHVTRPQLKQLLSPYFGNVTTKYLYDPFYLEGKEDQDIQSLKQEFYAYLIGLFNLEKLLPESVKMQNLINYTNLSYWKNIDKLLSPYFTLSDEEIKEIQDGKIDRYDAVNKTDIPIVSNLTVTQLSNNRIGLIAPRVALIGIGC